jgi:hypothetical protein
MITLSTHTSAPSKKAVVRSQSMLSRVEAQPPMNNAISSVRAVQSAAPVPTALPSGLFGSTAEMPIATPSVVRSNSVPSPASTPPNTPPQEMRIPAKGSTPRSTTTLRSTAIAVSL